MANVTTKDKTRLDFRLTVEKKKLIEKAASLTGKTVSDFAITVLIEEANDVIEKYHQTKLSDHDRDLFLSLIDSDEPPNSKLKKAVKHYQKQIIS